jgi:tripartite ATP-independent transporter DctM subunit
MSPELVGLLGLLFLFLLMFAGMPLGIGLAFSGFLGFAYLFGINGALNQLSTVPFTQTASYALSIIPLFILMGDFAYRSGLTKDAYNAAYTLLGRLRGGLAISTIGACAAFAACTGSSMASAAMMTKVTLPEMRRHKYDPALATGAIAAGGTLGILIPPSNAMIFYSLVTEASVGKLFIAGILPGILLTILFMIAIYIWVMVKPKAGPAGEKSGWRQILNAVKRLWGVAILAGVVLGGLWGGVFSPTEAAAVGSFAAFLIGFAYKGNIKQHLLESLVDTTKTTAMIFVILIGAMIFSYFMTASGLPAALVNLINGLNISPLAVLIVILLIFIGLGCIFDTAGLTFVVLPIIYPIVKALGFDPIWFGILYVINSEMALITPPIGMNVFVVAGMVKDIPMYTIFRGIVPFFIAMCVCTVIIIAFPQIALVLPSLMRK